MTTPTLPVRLLNAVTSRRPVLVDPAFEASPLLWCWSCKRHLHDSEFPDLGVRCLDCMVTQIRDSDARLALRFLRANRPSTVRQLVAWRCVASSIERQAALYGIDVALPEPGRHRAEGAAS